MKKGLKNLAIASMVGVASLGLMTGCEMGDDEAYIKVKGLDTGYMVGETIDLENAKILYYSNKKDKTADEIKLNENMVANFNTETAGDKTMKVFFNGCELEIEYTVKSTTDFIYIFNKAYDNLLNAPHTHAETAFVEDGVESARAFINVQNNKYYSTYGDAEEYASGTVEKEWIEKSNNTWFAYLDERGDKSRCDYSDNIVEGNVMSYVAPGVLSVEKLTNDFITECGAVLAIDFDGNKTVLKFNMVFEEEYEGETYAERINVTYVIENEKFISMKYIEDTDTPDSVDEEITVQISYNIEDVEMEALPSDAHSWELQEYLG